MNEINFDKNQKILFDISTNALKEKKESVDIFLTDLVKKLLDYQLNKIKNKKIFINFICW